MFNAPEVIRNIPEIDNIYKINDKQEEELDDALDRLNKNLSIENMDAETTQRWEKILQIKEKGEKIDNRKKRVLAKINERAPYTEKTLRKRLEQVTKKEVRIIKEKEHIKILLICENEDIKKICNEMIDNMIPLNEIPMIYYDERIRNTWNDVRKYTFEELKNKKWEDILYDESMRETIQTKTTLV